MSLRAAAAASLLLVSLASTAVAAPPGPTARTAPIAPTVSGSAHLPAAQVAFDGPALAFDFPSVEVGVAEYEEGPTGATVLLFRHPVMAAVDARGGAPGTVNTDALRLAYEQPLVNAITLAGGSAYGLSVATGVANAIKERTADPGNWKNIAVVPGAIIFDLGGRRYDAVTPDERLGRAALDAVRSGWIPLGARGAGRFAMQGGYLRDVQHSGQGAAFRQSGTTKVLVVTVVNAVGSIVDRNGQLVRCAHPINGGCGSIADRLASHLAALGAPKLGDANGGDAIVGEHSGPTANTTISVVVTNQALPYWALQRLAVQVHNSMARAIQPFGTQFDGDTLFAVSTGEVRDSAMSGVDLGTLASEAAWDAILSSVPALPPERPRTPVTLLPAVLDGCIGRYEFAPGTIAQIRRGGEGLEIQVAGQESLYLPADTWVPLTAIGTDAFELATPAADLLAIDRDARGRIVGLTINPGRWPIRARRLASR
jgi:L-aminopeptidase/D-esterase-like protein